MPHVDDGKPCRDRIDLRAKALLQVRRWGIEPKLGKRTVSRTPEILPHLQRDERLWRGGVLPPVVFVCGPDFSKVYWEGWIPVAKIQGVRYPRILGCHAAISVLDRKNGSDTKLGRVRSELAGFFPEEVVH